jgi:uncharacterized protein YciI
LPFLFFYLMNDEPDRVAEVAPRHAGYWREIAPPGYLGGPFADRSGGLITFEADTAHKADRLVQADPFLHEKLVSRWWLKEWQPAPADATASPEGRP